MNTYKINNRSYYLADEIYDNHTNLFKGCKSVRELVTKKNFVPDGKYLYAKYDKAAEEWNETDGASRKMDKLFISKKFFDSVEIEEDVVYDDLPEEIILEDNEKFFDNDGNIVEIQVVGERNVDKCYFLVKDIMDGFDLPNLHANIIRENSSYMENTHYKYFTITNKKKGLYLTYYGFMKAMNISFKLSHKTKKSATKWARQITYCKKINKYLIEPSIKNDETIGYVYCVTSDIVDAVKIGFWTGKLDGIRKRYMTSYGKNMYIFTVRTMNPRKLECKCHKFFADKKISGELFEKDHIKKYEKFLTNNQIQNDDFEDLWQSKYSKVDSNKNDVTDISCSDENEDTDFEEYGPCEKAPDLYFYDKNDEDDLDIDVYFSQTDDTYYIRGPDLSLLINDNIDFIEEYELIYNKHYKYFDESGEIVLYLTYYGTVMVLFNYPYKNEKTNKFVTWATSTLFTAQLGTIPQKHKLVANLLSVSTDAVKAVFDKASHTIPCVYLFSVGKVKDLRKSMKIKDKYDDDSYVYKYGMTIDLERRIKEHEKAFNKIKGAKLELTTSSFIDPQYISKAENKVKDLMAELKYNFSFESMVELAIISDKQIKFVKEQYGIISKLYLGHVADLVNKIKEKDNEIALMKERHEKELAIERHKNELLAEKHENELLKKEVEILKMKTKTK